MKPRVSATKPKLPDDLRQRVIALRRTHSLRDVAKATGLSLGTVKTITSRSGQFRDNLTHRALFTLPPIKPSAGTLPVVPELPPKQVAIGDPEIDAVLWLRQVIGTGQAALIERAMMAAKKVKTPMPKLEKRYADHLLRTTGSPFATLSAVGFGDLERLAAKSIERLALETEARARFGEDLFADTDAELFCIEALAGLRPDSIGFFSDVEAAARFKAKPALMPHTLADCLHELAYWDTLYRLRHSARTSIDDNCEGPIEATARRHFTFALLAEIRPRTRDEAKDALRYLIEQGHKDDKASDAILSNLVG